jgi:cbb3-type cytochrome oxidase subunit 3
MTFRELFRLDHDLVGWVNLISRAGLILFFAVFLLVVIWALTRRKSDVGRWGALALDDNTEPNSKELP